MTASKNGREQKFPCPILNKCSPKMRRVGLGRKTAGATDGLHVTFRQRTKHFGFFNMRMIDGFWHWADDTHAQPRAFNGAASKANSPGCLPS
jgi:hypothetical protein